MKSLWRSGNIRIDGDSQDWLGRLAYIDESGLSIGVQNDEQALYICLVTEDRMLGDQVMRGGLTLWFDSSGGKAKNLGIRYPMGKTEPPKGGGRGRPGSDRKEPDPGRPPSGEHPGAEDRSDRGRHPIALQDRALLLGASEGGERPIDLESLEGVEVRLHSVGNVFVYELKVPFQADGGNSFALGTQAGSTIHIGLEIEENKPDRDSSGPGGPGGMDAPGGGMGGMGGMGGRGGNQGPGGKGGMRPGSSRGTQGKAVHIWITTHLAELPSFLSYP